MTRRAAVLPISIALNRMAPGLEVGLAATETILGPIVGMVALLLGACWRVTTPVPAPPSRIPDDDDR